MTARILLLIMGSISVGTFIGEAVAGHKPDDALLVFAGSMFTTYAIVEHDDRDDDDHNRPPKRRWRP